MRLVAKMGHTSPLSKVRVNWCSSSVHEDEEKRRKKISAVIDNRENMCKMGMRKRKREGRRELERKEGKGKRDVGGSFLNLLQLFANYLRVIFSNLFSAMLLVVKCAAMLASVSMHSTVGTTTTTGKSCQERKGQLVTLPFYK